MMFVSLTTQPDPIEHEFLQMMLNSNDLILATGNALVLSYLPNPFSAKGYIHLFESAKMGGQQHPSWSILSEEQWLKYILDSDTNMEW